MSKLIRLTRKRWKQWGEIYRKDKRFFFISWSVPFIVAVLFWLIFVFVIK